MFDRANPPQYRFKVRLNVRRAVLQTTCSTVNIFTGGLWGPFAVPVERGESRRVEYSLVRGVRGDSAESNTLPAALIGAKRPPSSASLRDANIEY